MQRDHDDDSDDGRVFREEVGKVWPLKQDERAAPYRRKLSPWPQRRPLLDEESELRDQLSEYEVDTPEELEYSRPGVQKRVMRDLRRGRMEIGLELDLHGLTVRYARQVLQEFLLECRRRNIRCAQIIHGKGSSSANRQPVLKQKINLWLRQRDEVLAFCSATRRDGGTGAVYVLLSHRKQ